MQLRQILTYRYAPACIKLLAQYKSLMKLVGDDIGGVESFMKRFKVGHNWVLDLQLFQRTWTWGSNADRINRWTTQPLYIV
jgi:hypothetical protein